MKRLALLGLAVVVAGSASAAPIRNWSKFVRDPGNTVANALNDTFGTVFDASGNLYTCGRVVIGGLHVDASLVKFDPAGNEVWRRFVDGGVASTDIFQAIATDSSGNVYVAGSQTTVVGNTDWLMRKYDPNGNLVWSTTHTAIDPSTAESAFDIEVNSAGDIFVCGRTGLLGTNTDGRVLKLNSSGAVVGTFTIDGTIPGNQENLRWLKFDNSGNVCVGGFQNGVVVAGTTTNQEWLVAKVNPSTMALVWRGIEGVPNAAISSLQGMAVDSVGNIIATGDNRAAGINFPTARVVRFNSATGAQDWTRAGYGAAVLSQSLTPVVDANDNVYASITTLDAGTVDVGMMKIDSAGTTVWSGSLWTSAPAIDDVTRSCVLDILGNPVSLGWSRVGGAAIIAANYVEFNASTGAVANSLMYQQIAGVSGELTNVNTGSMGPNGAIASGGFTLLTPAALNDQWAIHWGQNPEVVCPTSFNVVSGVDGGISLAQFCKSDDDSAPLFNDAFVANGQLVLEGPCSITAPTAMNVRVEANSDRGSDILLRIAAFNFSTNAYTLLTPNAAMSNADTVYNRAVASPANYVSTGGAVRLRLEFISQSDYDASDGWFHFVDEATVTVTQ